MGELHGEVEGVHFRAHKEAVFADRVGICKFEPVSTIPDINHFLWDNNSVSDLGFNKQNIINRTLQLLQRPEDNIRWSL